MFIGYPFLSVLIKHYVFLCLLEFCRSKVGAYACFMDVGHAKQ